MSDVFLRLVNLSITAGWLILAILIIRPFLKRAPKWICCTLWGLVAIRLICPFSLESAWSLIPSSETIPQGIAMEPTPAIDSGISPVNKVVNPIMAKHFTANPLISANPLQIWIPILSILWIIGMVVLSVYAVVSYLMMKKQIGATIPIDENVLASDEVKSPFILGVFRPMIYVSSSMEGETLDYVLRHERAHLKRHDHWWKPLGYILLTIYWFHPMMWVAYILLCRDIEMACDEKVIRDMDKEGKAAYSQALLECNFPRKRIIVCPVAFGEVGVKERVKTVLSYKKPTFWIIGAALLTCVILAVCFLTNPKTHRDSSQLEKELKESKNIEKVISLEKEVPQIVADYPANTDSKKIPAGEYVIFERYYEMSDGTWSTDTCSYKYRLEITGRTGVATRDTTYLYLSNRKEISFHQAMMASGFSSNMDDYFDEKEAKFIGYKLDGQENNMDY